MNIDHDQLIKILNNLKPITKHLETIAQALEKLDGKSQVREMIENAKTDTEYVMPKSKIYDQNTAVFVETTQAFKDILSQYPHLDKFDTRRSAAELNLLAQSVIQMARSGWSREMMLEQFDKNYKFGLEIKQKDERE